MSKGRAWTAPPPVPVRMIENAWIEAADGVRLGVQLWLPDVAQKVPVVLESIPYRKRDATRAYSTWWGRQLAAGGVAYARLDVRGSGDSGGLLVDEYLPQEQEDAALVIAWLAERPWCNGQVGMRGVSWGGFSTLQTAALAPPALKAIMPMCASDMRYTDDAHYVGGVFALTGLKWATSFKLVMAGPPDPEIYGAGWEAAWRERLAAAPPIAGQWLSHQRNDGFWLQGSVAADYGRIRCPTYLVGGWVDPYTEFVPRMLAGLQAPAKALIGPWRHGYPAPAAPGPGLDWLWEELRWWRHHLCGEATGVMDGPRLWSFLPERSAIEAAPGPLPGRWVGGAAFSPGGLSLKLVPGRLAATDGSEATVLIPSRGGVGLATPEWVPFAPPEYPQEQSADDAASLVFDSEPLEAPLDLLGNPRLKASVASSGPIAQLAARLCEVTPDGRSWLVTYAILNLTHRNGHAEPTPMTPGVFEEIQLTLGLVGRRLRAGSRVRLALSDGLWPLVWPPPEPVELQLGLAGAVLDLPARAADDDEPEFPIPVRANSPESGRGDPEVTRWLGDDGTVEFDEVWPAGGADVAETGVRIERSGPNVSLRMRTCEPESCRWRASQTSRYVRGEFDCALAAEVEITADKATFHVRERLTASLRGAEILDRTHETAVPRDLM